MLQQHEQNVAFDTTQAWRFGLHGVYLCWGRPLLCGSKGRAVQSGGQRRTHWAARNPKACCCWHAVKLPQVPYAQRRLAVKWWSICQLQLTVQAVKTRVPLDPPPLASSICLRAMLGSLGCR